MSYWNKADRESAGKLAEREAELYNEGGVMMKAKDKWWQNPNEVEVFARILNEAGKFRDKEAVIYFFEKPWGEDKPHKLWKEMGEPTVDDREDWNEFLDSFGRVEEKLKEVT